MSRAARVWAFTVVGAVAAFVICLWLAMVVKLSFLPKADGDRWVVAAAFAGVMAALVVAYGVWLVGRVDEPKPEGSDRDGGQQITGSPGSFQVGSGARVKMGDLYLQSRRTGHGEDEVGSPKA